MTPTAAAAAAHGYDCAAVPAVNLCPSREQSILLHQKLAKILILPVGHDATKDRGDTQGGLHCIAAAAAAVRSNLLPKAVGGALSPLNPKSLTCKPELHGIVTIVVSFADTDEAMSDSGDDHGGPHYILAPAAAAWLNLPHGLVSLSLHDVALEGQDLLVMGAATPALRWV